MTYFSTFYIFYYWVIFLSSSRYWCVSFHINCHSSHSQWLINLILLPVIFKCRFKKKKEKTKKGNVDGGVKKNVGIFSFGKKQKEIWILIGIACAPNCLGVCWCVELYDTVNDADKLLWMFNFIVSLITCFFLLLGFLLANESNKYFTKEIINNDNKRKGNTGKKNCLEILGVIAIWPYTQCSSRSFISYPHTHKCARSHREGKMKSKRQKNWINKTGKRQCTLLASFNTCVCEKTRQYTPRLEMLGFAASILRYHNSHMYTLRSVVSSSSSSSFSLSHFFRAVVD